MSNYIQKDGVKVLSQNDLTNDLLSKLNNQIKVYTAGEVLKASMGEVLRIWNGGLFKYIGDYPTNNTFVCIGFDAELNEVPSRWLEMLSTHPPIEYGVVNPKSIAPNTIRWHQINGQNISVGSTADFGANIDVLDYQYTYGQMLVKLQSNGVISSIKPKVSNGKLIELVDDFSISIGEVFVPDAIGSLWENTDVNLLKTVGGIENQLSSSHFGGTFSQIPIDKDVVWGMRIHASTSVNSQLYFGFKSNKTDHAIGENSNDAPQFRLYPNVNKFSMPLTTINWTVGGYLEIKRVSTGVNSADLEMYVDTVLVHTQAVNVTEVWYPYYFVLNLMKITEIELKLT